MVKDSSKATDKDSFVGGEYYLVLDGDDCASISIAKGISLTDFYFLNPMVNSTCGNLWTDTYYCVEAVGNIATYLGYG